MMFIPDHAFNEEEYIITSTGNIVSRSAVLHKPQSIEIPGGKCIIEKDVIIDGNFAPIKINRYVLISERTKLIPPSITDGNSVRYIPMTIEKYVTIGSDCIIESAVIGLGVVIGNNCHISSRSILKDFVLVEDNTIVPPDMVLYFVYIFFDLDMTYNDIKYF